MVERVEHEGPLRIQRAFYPPNDDACHVYLLHPPGGVVGGDELAIDVTLREGARVLVTTPGAGKIYRSNGQKARIYQRLRVGAGACLQWLPQETILFDGADVDGTTRADIEEKGRFAGWEIVCLGRPACDSPYRTGRSRHRFELWRGHTPLCIERTSLLAGDESLDARWGAGGGSVLATMLVSLEPDEAESPELRGLARRMVEEAAAAPPSTDPPGQGATGELWSSTITDHALVVRYSGRSAPRARRVFTSLWRAVSEMLVGRTPASPRIWMT